MFRTNQVGDDTSFGWTPYYHRSMARGLPRSRRGRWMRRVGLMAPKRRRRMTMRRRRQRMTGGWHRLQGRVSNKRRTYTLKRRSPFKRRLRGYKVNPYVAFNRRHRRSYRHNPPAFSLARVTRDPVGVIVPATVTIGSAVGVVVGGNWLYTMVPVNLRPAQRMMGTLAVAVSRGAVAWGADRFLPLGRYRSEFRIGAGVGIVGSLVLDLLGLSFTLGRGDAFQMPQSFVPAGVLGGGGDPMLTGAGAYLARRPGVAGTGAYVSSLRGVARATRRDPYSPSAI